MPNSRTSTLLSTERAFRPLVRGVTIVSSSLVAALLGWSCGRLAALPWICCAVPALALEASNLHYARTHALTTVGMIPVALFALLTPCVACLATGALPLVPRVLASLAVTALVVVFGVFVFWFCRLRRAYTRHPLIARDAALIVLGGAIRNGKPARTLARRLDTAARLWQESPARLIVPSGGPTPDLRTTEAREMARYLQRCGVANSSLLLETHARNTYENLRNSLELLDEWGHHGQRCVVSSDYHLWRALRDARKLGAELVPVAAPTPLGSWLQQWCREVLTILSGR